MSATVKYPQVEVQLSGNDGNAFAIIGSISKALRREVSAEAATQYSNEAMESGSYDDLLVPRDANGHGALMMINLVPSTEYKRDSYGIVLVSETEHDFYGPGIHNRHHSHVLQVWDNQTNAEVRGLAHMVDPWGHETAERYSYLWSAQASVISARPQDRPVKGQDLALGAYVELNVNGYAIGQFKVEAKPLHDPHLIKEAVL